MMPMGPDVAIPHAGEAWFLSYFAGGFACCSESGRLAVPA
jgi:hypothetical protein